MKHWGNCRAAFYLCYKWKTDCTSPQPHQVLCTKPICQDFVHYGCVRDRLISQYKQRLTVNKIATCSDLLPVMEFQGIRPREPGSAVYLLQWLMLPECSMGFPLNALSYLLVGSLELQAVVGVSGERT